MTGICLEEQYRLWTTLRGPEGASYVSPGRSPGENSHHDNSPEGASYERRHTTSKLLAHIRLRLLGVQHDVCDTAISGTNGHGVGRPFRAYEPGSVTQGFTLG